MALKTVTKVMDPETYKELFIIVGRHGALQTNSSK